MSNIQTNKPDFNVQSITLFAGIFFFIISLFLTGFLLYPFASSKKSAYFTKPHQILINEKRENSGLIKNHTIYIPVSTVKNVLHANFYKETRQLILTTKQKIYRIPFNNDVYFMNDQKKKMHSPIISHIREFYISIDLLEKIYPLKYTQIKENGVIWIEQNGNTYLKGRIKSHSARKAYLRLRKESSLWSPYTAEVSPDEQVRIEKHEGSYLFVRKKNGAAGFIKSSFVTSEGKTVIKVPAQTKSVSLSSITSPVYLSWEAVYTKTPEVKSLPKMPGVNVVSPTWFKLKNEKADVTDIGDMAYSNWARKQKLNLWPLFSNSFDPKRTKKAFSTFSKRHKIIMELLAGLKKYQAGGLNFDIENVYPEDGRLVTEFVREAAAYLHNSGYLVSMNITFIGRGNWSEFYQRHQLAAAADYLIVMAYDEHTATEGSVASFPWVTQNLHRLLKEVPRNRLILGIPFYARLWKEKQANGDVSLSSKALTMDQTAEWMKEKKITPVFDPATGQHYAEYKDREHKEVYKIWLEDPFSLTKRAQIAEENHLAGIAAWSRYFANESAWTSLASSLSAFYSTH